MLNQTVLVGRIVKIGKLNQNEQGKVNVSITLSVPRNYKNENGEYETDLVPCELSGMVAKSSVEYCKQGDLVGVKGHIRSDKEGVKILADKVTFLSNSRNNEEMER